MRSKLKQLLISYLFCVALLLTMGMCFGTESSNYDVVSPRPSDEYDLKVHLADFTDLSLIQSSFRNVYMIPSVRNEVESQISGLTIKKEQYSEATKIESMVVKYEVTSFYLNVRANSNDTSTIIGVVSNGTLLEVLNKTDNGWLTLKDGGFVNGKYAKITQSEPEKISSVIPSVHSAAIKDNGLAPHEPTSIIKSDSGLTEAYIEKIFKGTSLAGDGLENAILEIEEEFGINAYFTIAVMKLESAHGESRIAKDKNNLFGLNAIDGNEYNQAFSFKTKGDSVRKFGQLIAQNYIDEGYTTVERVSDKYCEANPKWAGLVRSIMTSDYQKL